MLPRAMPLASSALLSQKNLIEEAAIRRAWSRRPRAVSPPTESPIRVIQSRMLRPSETSRLSRRTASVCR